MYTYIHAYIHILYVLTYVQIYVTAIINPLLDLLLDGDSITTEMVMHYLLGKYYTTNFFDVVVCFCNILFFLLSPPSISSQQLGISYTID